MQFLLDEDSTADPCLTSFVTRQRVDARLCKWKRSVWRLGRSTAGGLAGRPNPLPVISSTVLPSGSIPLQQIACTPFPAKQALHCDEAGMPAVASIHKVTSREYRPLLCC